MPEELKVFIKETIDSGYCTEHSVTHEQIIKLIKAGFAVELYEGYTDFTTRDDFHAAIDEALKET